MIPIPASLLSKLGIALLALLIGFFGGCHVQKGRDADKLAAKDAALKASAISLGAAADALRAQNDANARAIAESKARERAAEAARGVAEQALAIEQKRAETYADRLAAAAARRPGCKALLLTDVRQTCGL
jgi:hypothetical protein